MTATIRVEKVVFREGYPHPEYWARDHPGEDGAVYYEILIPCTCTPRCNIVCEKPACVEAQKAGRPFHHHYERQAFARDGPKKRPGATEEDVREDRANIWGWNGDRAAPTITPSFLGFKHRPYRVHLFLTRGEIVLCDDSTVVLA